MYEFRWNHWNLWHIAEHGVATDAVEHVVTHARRPYPRREGGGKYRVRGRADDGTYLQVIYVFSPLGVVYVIHARPLSDKEKRSLRRSEK